MEKADSRGIFVIALCALLTGVFAYLYFFGGEETRQESVARFGSEIMPFDLDATTHVFEPTANGGVQTVVADDPSDAREVELIRRHLREEAAAFRRGDFSDPAFIHGDDMPGIDKLSKHLGALEVRYREIEGGAQIIYETPHPELVAALHVWFEAQLTDHGEHAEPAN